MTVDEVMQQLRTLGTAQNVKVYGRHGATNTVGVSFENLKKLQRRIKQDHDLALGLWATGLDDARLLACMIADPNRLSEAELDAWLGEISYYVLVDLFCRHVASRKPGAPERGERWTRVGNDWFGQAGWDTLAIAALQDPNLEEAYLLGLVDRIERDIHASSNRTRHAMNNALIAIGLRNDRLEQAALAAARRIGRVVVDHGETACKTPDAETYILKARARRKPVGAR